MTGTKKPIVSDIFDKLEFFLPKTHDLIGIQFEIDAAILS